MDETITHILGLSGAGNLYVNRSTIGAVVGVQPFGGHGLSGTGPKAGGPLYLRRLMRRRAATVRPGQPPEGARRWEVWLRGAGNPAAAAHCAAIAAATPVGAAFDLPGPVGEHNRYTTIPRGNVLCTAEEPAALFRQVSAALATGNRALVPPGSLPESLSPWATPASAEDPLDAALYQGSQAGLLTLLADLARRPGLLVPTITADDSEAGYALECLVRERVVTTNTTAAGGNASLMALGDD